MESTSHYHLLLFQFFSDAGYEVIVVNPLQSNALKNISVRKIKTDKVDAYRLECTRKLFLTLGLSDDEAQARSILVFAYVFGHSLMSYDRNNPKVSEFKRWIAERITGR